MPNITVSPTRMELTRLKGKLRTAQRGHKLLKDKRDELMKQFLDTVREVRSLRAEVEEDLMMVHKSFTVASALMSSQALEQALLYPKQGVELTMTFQNIMSVNVPVYDFQTKTKSDADIYPYGFAATSGELDAAVDALGHVFRKMLKLAQIEKSAQLMAEEIEKTRRRVNALEYVKIPEMQESIKYITMKLEENERANTIRLMKVKDMVLKDAIEERRARDAGHLLAVNKEVHLYEPRAGLQQNAAEHAERAERETCEDARLRRRKERSLNGLEPLEHAEAHQNGEADDRDVPGERVHAVRIDRLVAGVGAAMARIDAFALVERTFVEGAHGLHVAALVGDVDEEHAQDDAEDHAGGGDGVAERQAVCPLVGEEALEAANRAVTALEADFQQVAERGRQVEGLREPEARETQSHDILSPRDELCEAKLREGRGGHVLRARLLGLAEEKRRKDHIDEETRQLAYDVGNLLGGRYHAGWRVAHDKGCH